MKSKLLIQTCSNAAVQDNDIKTVQQTPGIWKAENSSSKYNRLKIIHALHEFLYISVAQF